jgi:purine-binding chemotaxis protein CheW
MSRRTDQGAQKPRGAARTRPAPRPSRRETEKVLEERARALAQPPPAPEARGGLQLISFTLDGEQLALELDHVRAVGRTPPITPLPSAPGALAGVTNFRGEIVAVFDVGAWLGGDRPVQARPYIVALGRGRIEFAILADSVEELLRTAPEAIVRRPWRAAPGEAAAFGGITADALNVLDGAALLDDERFVIGGEGEEWLSRGGQ